MKFNSDHCRGPLPAKDYGVSHGGGQTVNVSISLAIMCAESLSLQHPSNLKTDSQQNDCAFKAFRTNLCVIHAAGFGSSGFSYYGPKMYKHYCSYSTRLCEHDPGLRWNFPNSVFPAVTANRGPAVVAYNHLDYGNAAVGWCSITAAGTFYPKKEGI